MTTTSSGTANAGLMSIETQLERLAAVARTGALSISALAVALTALQRAGFEPFEDPPQSRAAYETARRGTDEAMPSVASAARRGISLRGIHAGVGVGKADR